MLNQGCIYLIENTEKQQYCETPYYFITFFFLNIIDSYAGKAEFSAQLLQSLVTHDPSEIILIC